MGAERNGADSILPDGFLWLAEVHNALIRFGNEEDREMIRCNSPFAYMDRCVIDMDSQQSCGGTICCDMAEDMDFDREHILRRCEHAENEED